MLLKYGSNSRGISLLEVTASIVIIGIILISFFSVFPQVKKSTVASEQLVDSTYIAQQQMEELYDLTNDDSPLNSIIEYFKDVKNASIIEENTTTEVYSYKLPHDSGNTSIEITIAKANINNDLPSYPLSLYNVTVKIFENNILKSTMENIIEIKP